MRARRYTDDGFLIETGDRLTGSLNQRRVLRAVVELAVAHLADAAVAVGPSDGRRVDWVRLVGGGRVGAHQAPAQEFAAVPWLAEVWGSDHPVPHRPLLPSAVPEWLWPPGFLPGGKPLLVAMPGHAGPGAALILARGPDRPAFNRQELTLARTFATQAGRALAAAGLYHEQGAAMAVLRAELLPPPLPRIDGVELAGGSQPAEEGLQIGGDFFDVFPPAGDPPRSVAVLGDVCGKGASAAVMTTKVRESLRALQLVEQRPTELLRVLNEALLQSGGGRYFVTLVVGVLGRAAAHRDHLELTFATGGHPPPMVLRADGSVTEVPVAGSLIGVIPDLELQPAVVDLAPGEVCLLYSDGLTEARGGRVGRELYGDRRLRRALASCWGMPARATVERLQQLVSEWVRGEDHDDTALLVIRAVPAGGPS